MTFLSGPRACLGWRIAYVLHLLSSYKWYLFETYSVLGMQTFLFGLMGKFEFGMTDKAERIVRQPMLIMGPVVDGELDRGVQVPLAVSLTPQVGDHN